MRITLEGLVDFSLYDLAQRMAQRLHVPLCYYPQNKKQEQYLKLQLQSQSTSLLLQYEYHALQYHEYALSENWQSIEKAVFCGSNERDSILASVQLNSFEYQIYTQWKQFIPPIFQHEKHRFQKEIMILFYQASAKKTTELQKIHEAYQVFGHSYNTSPILFVNCDTFNPLNNETDFNRLCYYLQPDLLLQPRFYI